MNSKRGEFALSVVNNSDNRGSVSLFNLPQLIRKFIVAKKGEVALSVVNKSSNTRGRVAF